MLLIKYTFKANWDFALVLFIFLLLFKYICINNVPPTLPKTFRMDANS